MTLPINNKHLVLLSILEFIVCMIIAYYGSLFITGKPHPTAFCLCHFRDNQWDSVGKQSNGFCFGYCKLHYFDH